MNLRHKTSYEQACEQERVQVYRLNLHQLRLVDEFIGFVPAEVVGKILKVDTPEREPRHIAFLVARAETSLCPTFRYLGRSLDLTGAEVTIVSSDEKYPESEIDILEAAFLPHNTNVSIEIPNIIFRQVIDCLRDGKPLEAELLCESYLDDPHHPESLNLRFHKLWLRFPPLNKAPRSTMFQTVLSMITSRINNRRYWNEVNKKRNNK